MTLSRRIHEQLENARAESLLRRLRTVERWDPCVLMVEGKQLVDFSSSDYLCLAHDAEVLGYIESKVAEYGLGAVSSPLISGYTGLHAALERMLAVIFRQESALLFPSGWQGNVTVIDALFNKGDIIFSDEMNHASLVDGCRLSKSDVVVFEHGDYDDLGENLHSVKAGIRDENLIGIISDTVFSIDGDTADVPKLIELKRKYNAVLMLDAAHGLPCIGREGESLLGFDEYLSEADVVTTSLGKYFAAGGGMACCSKKLREFLVNRMRGYIYSSSYSTLLVAAILAAIERIGGDPSLVSGLKENIEYLRANLADLGLLGRSGALEGPICAIPVRAERALEAGEKLIGMGLLVVPVRYPSVPMGTAKLRISIMRGHTRDMMDRLLEGFCKLKTDGFIPSE